MTALPHPTSVSTVTGSTPSFWKVSKVHLALLVRKVHRDPKGLPVLPVRQDPLATTVLLDLPDRVVTKEIRDLSVKTVRLVPPALLDRRATLDRPARKVTLVHKVTPDHRANRVCRALTEPLVTWVRPVPMERRVTLALVAMLARRAIPATKVSQATPGLPVLPVLTVHKAHPDRKVSPVRRVKKDPLVSRDRKAPLVQVSSGVARGTRRRTTSRTTV